METDLQLHRARLRSEEESQRREAAENDARTLREQLAEARRKAEELEEALQKARSERRTALRRLADEGTKHVDRQEHDSQELEQLRTNNEVLAWSLEVLENRAVVMPSAFQFRTQHTARLLRRATKTGATEQQTSATLNGKHVINLFVLTLLPPMECPLASTSASTSTEGNAQQVTVKSEICDIDDLPGTNRTVSISECQLSWDVIII